MMSRIDTQLIPKLFLRRKVARVCHRLVFTYRRFFCLFCFVRFWLQHRSSHPLNVRCTFDLVGWLFVFIQFCDKNTILMKNIYFLEVVFVASASSILYQYFDLIDRRWVWNAIEKKKQKFVNKKNSARVKQHQGQVNLK